MSLFEQVEAEAEEQEIAPGKRLIRVGDDRGLSLFERLNYRLHRLAWRTPLHKLRLRGRVPLRLLAVPKDPVAGDRAAGEALLDGRFLHNGTEISIERLDFSTLGLPQDFSLYLQSFAWLRDLAAAASRERGAKVAEGLVRKWLAAFDEEVCEPAWRADLWGRRILFWTAYAPYILSSRDLVYRSRLLHALARGARHLDRTADKVLPGLPRIMAWSGVITAALVVQGGPARLRTGEAGLMRALSTSVHDDGGLASRSPTEQLALVETLAQLRAVYIAGRRDVPEWLSETLVSAAAALLAATLGDEALSSWQGGHMASRRRVLAAVDASGADVPPLRRPRGWGYQRLQAKASILVFDAAPPPPPRALIGGCASTLAFEFSDGANRLIVNCGGVGEAKGALPDSLVHALRTTAAHSTLTLGDRNSTAIHEDGSLGKGVAEVEMSRDETGGILRVEASHDGYMRRFGLIHERRLLLSSDGLQLTGEDRLYGAARRRRRSQNIPFAVRFHLAPSVEATTTADGQGALLRIRGGGVWQFRCRGGLLSTEDSLWVDGHARPRATLQLVIGGQTPPEGMTISWELKRAR
ncbi:heparinase II/III family protein [Sphingosinicella sp. CPCC 101087]|uniref:heparinase II/III family protein n=1 Tax=Sphingosinicella sp. CPCC 101087 TaxID=2497754 RepID=UPI00101D07AA|nr:heparinase II/III family protein [Sphingosinicella sp. CPCC 101087]